MQQITVKYEDLDGNMQEETLFFHINKTEMSTLDLKYKDGFEAEIKRIQESEDREALFTLIKDVVIMSYGQKSANGKAFIKKPEVVEEFQYGPMLDEVLIHILQKEDGSGVFEFLLGCLPVSAKAAAIQKAQADPRLSNFVGR